jgi:hypothetical protein
MSIRPRPALRMLCFVPAQNTTGKSDMSGAFLPEARAFARHHGLYPELVVRRFPAAAPIPKRRAACVEAFSTAQQPLDLVAFFCHGWRDGLQAGFLRANVLVLARMMGMHARLDAHVLLYACETGRDSDAETDDDSEPGPGGDGGFADELRDACEALGRRVTVAAHATAGHCSQNPYARRFAPGAGGRGGEWYVEPLSPLWRLWVRALRDPRSTLKFRFPMMTPAEIAVELGGGAGGPLVA